ncbi:MAG: hypothetical protein K6A41_04340 [Bacteroidales bacterium]|nr:hypothetical protein [Bacteroidales bacterium]
MRRQMTISAGGLPSGYTQLSYIQGTGSQHIVTDIYSGRKTNVSLDMTMVGSGGIFVGWMSAANNYCRSYIAAADYNVSLGYGDGYNSGYYNSSVRMSVNGRYLLEYQTLSGSHWLKIDGNTDFSSASSSTYITTQKFTIFARNVDGTANAKSKYKLHELYISIDDVLMGHFIPVLRTSDSKPGLWDLVTSTFYTNAGSGEFSYA